jgi:hypothetical protein
MTPANPTEDDMRPSTIVTLNTQTTPLRKSRRWAALVAGTALLALSGCATTGVVKTGTAAAAKPADCLLDMYLSRADVPRPFASVCIVSTESGSTLFNDRSDEGRMQAVREQACGCGADAVVIRSMSRTATQFGRGYSQARVTAEAIVYRPAD